MPSTKTLRFAGAGIVAAGAIAAGVQFAGADSQTPSNTTTTPIKHVVVLFQENISFDHYFGTYPHALNNPGETPFTALPNTPTINGLTPSLLTNNPNAANPVRLGPTDVVPTIGCDNNHSYSPEQKAYDGGLADKFVENTTGGAPCAGSEVMNYYDGNTVTGLWNYAQHFAMSDNSYGTGFGPSTPGAIELVSGNTATAVDQSGNPIASNGSSVDNGTIYSNSNPYLTFDGCSPSDGYALGTKTGAAATSAANTSKNVGDLMNAANVTWGWFEGGFTPTSRATPDATYPVAGKPTCASSHVNVAHANQADYDAHHNPFAYYKSTANPEHLAPTGAIGATDQANHQYDTTDFDAAVAAGNLPAVSFVKAPHYEDGHAGYSDPVDEQRYLAQKINAIEHSPDWASTAIIIAYDDSDGWYDHQASPIVRSSSTPEDFLNGTGQCGTTHTGSTNDVGADRCGFGPRLPLLVISPYAKSNFVSHAISDQTSVLRFIEDNWSLGRIGNGSLDVKSNPINDMFDFNQSDARSPAVFLDPDTGAVASIASTTPTPTPVTGPTGATGAQGPAGENGANGAPGAAGAAGSNGGPGATGLTGLTGPAGPAGPEGSVGKITCSGHLSGKTKVVVTCKATKATASKTAFRLRLLHGTSQVATAASTISKGRTFKVTLKSRKTLVKGRYSLGISIAQTGKAAAAQTGTIKL
ncbi:MAG: alkaline phosphatase family protein [Solirubrobacteraceae bacterium]|nr:alkaline phosphatase family protein [Patulibacter sp.]